MKYLITGGCGFLGSNLAAEVLTRGEELAVFDNLSRFGAEQNLAWLRSQGEFLFQYGDIRDPFAVARLVKEFRPNIIFHLAGQVAMTTSIANPRLDFEINALGTLNVLEAVREHCPECGILYSSTNKVFGDLEYLEYEETPTRYVVPSHPNGFDESTLLDFHSPYGCSKGAADQYLLDYHRIFGLKTVVFRHSSMYGGRQFATIDQGWVGWFCQKAVETKKGVLRDPFTIFGNGKQVRDLLFASDTVNLYLAAADKINKLSGQVFCVGGGQENSSSLLELFDFLERELEVKMIYKQMPPRESDQKVFVANNEKAKEMIGWWAIVSKEAGIRKMVTWANGQ
ncbi:MAG: NAD-dependent epimerase/dehydratase family protein [Negativicutes bacterium]|nr:NAD-dependent epimerase/dehydratase family protein [Negativicutes bacterium]